MKEFKKETLHIIMPMAGGGTRFIDAGYNVPKPLIKLNGKELYRRALDSINISDKFINIKYTFIIRQDFIDNYNIDKEIKKYYSNSNIISINYITRGALETVMLAKNFIDDEDNVISLDCDIEFECQRYIDRLHNKVMNKQYNPMVLSFYSKDPKYSYVKTIEDSLYGNYVVEKNPISTHALGGCYYLGNGKTFKFCAQKVISDYNQNIIKDKELYLSLVYNYILKETNTYVEVIDMNLHNDHYWSYGTPEDYEKYNYNRNIWDD